MSEPAVPVRPVDLGYALPPPSSGSRVAASLGITIAGLVILAFGGCFLIGVMIQLYPQMVFGPAITTPWELRQYVFHAVLYVMAFVSFGSGGLLTYRGVSALSQVVVSK